MSLKDWVCFRLWRREGYAKNGWRYPDIAYLDEYDKALVLARLCSVRGRKPRGAGFYHDHLTTPHKLVGPFATLNECVEAAERATEKLKP
jgi:hypothetical protein